MKYCIPFILLACVTLGSSAEEWTQDSFFANQYASRKSAARAVADRWAADMARRHHEDPKRIVLGGPDQIPADAREGVITAVRTHFPRSEVIFECCLPPGALAKMGDESIKGDFEYQDFIPGSGRLALDQFAVLVYDKPWADDFAAYLNSRVDKSWVVGISSSPATSEDAAFESAAKSAAEKLIPVIRPFIDRWGMGQFTRDDGRLAARILERLEQPRFVNVISDRFVQRFERPYGTVWRQSLLINTSDSSLDILGRDIAMQVQYERTWARRATGSSVAILTLTYLVYLLANAVTKGYFKWKLRAAVFAVFVIGLVILARLMRMG